MNNNEIYSKLIKDIASLKGKELSYVSNSEKTTKITDINTARKTISAKRGQDDVHISFDRIEIVSKSLASCLPIHIDTIFKSSGNDRTIIESILCHTPNIGYMKPKTGRNHGKNKVIQWFDGEIHELGCMMDVSGQEFESAMSSKIETTTLSLYKPFLLFAGISGTGKTRFIREQAKNNHELDNYCLVPVRPDWHEPSDLLGYISRLGGNNNGEYIPTPVLKFIVQAWKHIITDIHPIVFPDGKSGLDWEGNSLADIAPFWLCLDEMNLAPVEQYFADYLSILETRHWFTPDELSQYNNENECVREYVYECQPLLKADVLRQLEPKAQISLATKLGLDLSDSLQGAIWDYFTQNGIALPFNLIVAGTVNMDETTHGFSRKVVDRALTFDFNEFFPNKFDDFFAPVQHPKPLSYPIWSDGRAALNIEGLDGHREKSVAFLKAVNEVLQQTPFELAYRAMNELMLALLAHIPQDHAHLVAIWDDFMMCKVLPRIEGDSDKLRCYAQVAEHPQPESLLDALETVLEQQFGAQWHGDRLDLFSTTGNDSKENGSMTNEIRVPCRSRKKLAWMKDRLVRQCFTSYWP